MQKYGCKYSLVIFLFCLVLFYFVLSCLVLSYISDLIFSCLSCKKIVFSSSATVYGERNIPPLHEQMIGVLSWVSVLVSVLILVWVTWSWVSWLSFLGVVLMVWVCWCWSGLGLGLGFRFVLVLFWFFGFFRSSIKLIVPFFVCV